MDNFYQEPFQYRTVGEDDGISPVGIVMHGFGSNMDDLYGLAMQWNKEVPYWIVPQAPVDMYFMLSYHAYAWFPDTTEDLHQALTGTLWNNISQIEIPSLQTAAKKVIDELILPLKNYQTRPIILAGFSQGGIMASEILLQCLSQNIAIHKVIIMSSCAVSLSRWKQMAESIQSNKITFPKILQTHGNFDMVLPLLSGKEVEEFWKQYCPHEMLVFDGSHEVPTHVIAQVSSFLEQ